MAASSDSRPSSAFNQTLQFITSIKLQELEKQRVSYKKYSQDLRQKAEACGHDLPLKVETLLTGVRAWTGPGAIDPKGVVGGTLNLSDLDTWLLQAKKDPSFSPQILSSWANILESHISHSIIRFDCASLFGNLMSEWLGSGDASNLEYHEAPESTSEPEDTFVEVGREEMHQQKEKLNSIIFESKEIDKDALVSYLSDIFSEEKACEALEDLRENIRDFSESLLRRTITAQDVRFSIEGVLASPLLDEEKRTTLREFSQNSTALDEVASVLNMRLSHLDTWSWPSQGAIIEMRRHLNGKYRAFTDPDVLDAIFLQYLGISWQVQFKDAFLTLFGEAHKSSFPPLTKSQNDRRAHYLKEYDNESTIEYQRQLTRSGELFLAQLTRNRAVISRYDDLLDAKVQDESVSPAAMKQKLLQIMATECHLNKALHGKFTVLRSDLEWFGPSLPHDAIFTILSFFGVTEPWINFFRTFLRIPLRFKEEPNAELRIRERGTPISYALSVVFGEVILLAMDFAVNQKADGLFLHRMHDDLWLWSPDSEKCAVAWREMNRYADLVGLKFNVGKTGVACVGEQTCPGLPSGDIRWGFLLFDAQQGIFIIDQKDVDKEVVELRLQLAATKSIFGWVNKLNKYMTFFVRNFGGRPAPCFGIEHVDDMIDTLGKIQRAVFSDAPAGAVERLRNMIEARFGVRDLPMGYFYFPLENGGLGLQNPIIELLAVRSEFDANPHQGFEEEMKEDRTRYQNLKTQWEESANDKPSASDSLEFMTFEEYISARETRLKDWGIRYLSLLQGVEPRSVTLTPAVDAALRSCRGWANLKGWTGMDYYQKWTVALFCEELVNRFGSLEIVDASLIPIGMVQLFSDSKMKMHQ